MVNNSSEELSLESSLELQSLKERKLSSDAMRVFNDMRQRGELCDVEIKTQEGQSFQAHKAILSACSPYFRSLFTCGLSIRTPKVHLKKAPTFAVTQVINYAYTREVELDFDNFQTVTTIADFLLMDGLVKLCHNFILQNLTVDNCLMVHQFAKFYTFQRLERKTWKFILANIENILKQSPRELLLDLKAESLSEILNDDNLNVSSESAVWEVLDTWLKVDPSERKVFLPTLIRCVRLTLLPKDYFEKNILGNELVRKDSYCRELILEVFQIFYGMNIHKYPEQFPKVHGSKMIVPRFPNEVILVIGGWSVGSPTGLVETYDVKAQSWQQLPHLEDNLGPRAYHGCAIVKKHMFLIGGFDGVEYFNSVRVLDLVKGQWFEKAPMNSQRCYVSVVTLNGHIYAMGGYNGSVRLNTMEKYEPGTNQWSQKAPMHAQRSDAHAAVLNGKIYICGGFNGQSCMSSAEVYDPESGKWNLIADMNSRRSGVGVSALNGYIYAIGGFNGNERLRTAEYYDPSSNTWRDLPEMISRRSNFALEVIQDTIFVIGGFNGTQTVSTAEYFDEARNRWVLIPDMHINRSALYACVLRDIPDLQRFINRQRLRLWDEARTEFQEAVEERKAKLRIAELQDDINPLRRSEGCTLVRNSPV